MKSSCISSVLVAALIATGFARAAEPKQSPAGVLKVDPAEQARILTAQRAALDTAKTLAHANNFAAAEVAITQSNRAKPDTVAWRMETAQRLLQITDSLGRDGRGAAASPLVTSALQHLTLAEQQAKRPETKAALKAQAAFIHERYRGDNKAAIASYQAADALATNPRTKEALARLQSTEDILRQKAEALR